MIWRGFCGFVMGILAFGFLASVGAAIGIPPGLHWWALAVPFLVFMTYAGAITK